MPAHGSTARCAALMDGPTPTDAWRDAALEQVAQVVAQVAAQVAQAAQAAQEVPRWLAPGSVPAAAMAASVASEAPAALAAVMALPVAFTGFALLQVHQVLHASSSCTPCTSTMFLLLSRYTQGLPAAAGHGPLSRPHHHVAPQPQVSKNEGKEILAAIAEMATLAAGQ